MSSARVSRNVLEYGDGGEEVVGALNIRKRKLEFYIICKSHKNILMFVFIQQITKDQLGGRFYVRCCDAMGSKVGKVLVLMDLTSWFWIQTIIR